MAREESSLEFILKLNSILHGDAKTKPSNIPLDANEQKPSHVSSYSYRTEIVLTKSHTNRLLQILEESDTYFIYASNFNDRLSESFAITSLEYEKDKVLLTFERSHLPSKKYFAKFIDIYYSESNVLKANDAGINIERDDSNYTQDEY